MVSECELRAYAKAGAYFSIAFVKKSNPRAFRYLLVIPTMTALHTLTYIPKDLEKCRLKQTQS